MQIKSEIFAEEWLPRLPYDGGRFEIDPGKWESRLVGRVCTKVLFAAPSGTRSAPLNDVADPDFTRP